MGALLVVVFGEETVDVARVRRPAVGDEQRDELRWYVVVRGVGHLSERRLTRAQCDAAIELLAQPLLSSTQPYDAVSTRLWLSAMRRRGNALWI